MAEKRLEALCHAVRWRVLFKYLGLLGIALAGLNAVPLAAAVALGEQSLVAPYALAVALLLAPSLPLARLAAPERLQLNEAIAVVVLAFVLDALAMSLPLSAASTSWLDGWFEAVSGITTTGLSTATAVADKPRTFLFARAWMQWYGGLGIVVLSLALFMHSGMFARQLIETEAAGDTLVSSTKAYARHILTAYSVLTAGAVFATWTASGDGFSALVHGLSAVSTGGFSRFDDSLAGLSPGDAAVLMLFSWLGAVSLPLYHRAWHTGPAILWLDPELRLLLVATALSASLLYLLWLPGGGAQWADALMLAVSAQSTTGFSTVSVGELDDASKLVMIGSMLVGGSIGSTAGGFKLLRLLLLLRLLQLMLARAAAPRYAVIALRLGEHRIEDEDLARALLIILLFAALILLSWFAFVAHGHPPLNALFEVVSATCTVGLSTGLTGAELAPLLKLVLCFDMMAGRLEIFALLLVLYPGTWFGKRSEAK